MGPMAHTKTYLVYIYLFLLTIFGPIYYALPRNTWCMHLGRLDCGSAVRKVRYSNIYILRWRREQRHQIEHPR